MAPPEPDGGLRDPLLRICIRPRPTLSALPPLDSTGGGSSDMSTTWASAVVPSSSADASAVSGLYSAAASSSIDSVEPAPLQRGDLTTDEPLDDLAPFDCVPRDPGAMVFVFSANSHVAPSSSDAVRSPAPASCNQTIANE